MNSDIKTKQIGKGETSVVNYNSDTKIVSKKIIGYKNYGIFYREAYWLQYLNDNNYDWCPKLIRTDPETQILYMEYAGEPINKKNAPQDWKEQLIKILADLQKENIKHNDIKNTEVLVKENKLYLIDYGWTSKGNDWTCGKGFNGSIKPAHVFFDEQAMERLSKNLD